MKQEQALPRDPTHRTAETCPMNVAFYTYDSEIYCEDCASSLPGFSPDGSLELPHSPVPTFEDNCTTDFPLHCHECGVFLENPLTPHGLRHVLELLETHVSSEHWTPRLTLYCDHYADDILRDSASEPPIDLYLHDGFSAYDIELDDEERERELLIDLRDCAAPGDASPAVAYVRSRYRVVASPDIRAHLQRYGAWSPEDLLDHDQNIDRMIWILGGEVRDNPDHYDLDEAPPLPAPSPSPRPQPRLRLILGSLK
ncbi:MAG: hypothetical protein OXU81_19675 [Gammaproteobacteria bacterium]|nr:hypothetical protein [Gammaproteobacteria bacterium]